MAREESCDEDRELCAVRHNEQSMHSFSPPSLYQGYTLPLFLYYIVCTLTSFECLSLRAWYSSSRCCHTASCRREPIKGGAYVLICVCMYMCVCVIVLAMVRGKKSRRSAEMRFKETKALSFSPPTSAALARIKFSRPF